MSKRLLRLRRVGPSHWTDGKNQYHFAEIDPSNDVFIPNGTGNRLLATDSLKRAVSVSSLSAWILSSDNSLEVTDTGRGQVNLTTPRAFQFFMG